MNNVVTVDVREYIASHSTLTLATAAEQRPWATSLFYASDSELRLYFISAANTRHVTEAMKNPQVAVTITEHDQAWQSIQGLQIEGTLATVGDADRHRVETLYSQKFPFIEALLQEQDNAEDHILRDRFLAAGFYAITPSFIRFIDNRKGFGFKQEFPVQV